ncbi:MAG: N-acetylmuramoyl-L-alanine amidase [Candidatus Gallimonas sp.]
MKFFLRHRIAIGIVALILAVAFTTGTCCFALSRTTAQAQRLTVVIDAGHGGIDGGVTGVKSGVKESDVNLAVSRELQAVFEEAGITVVQTRLTEAGLYDAATPGYKKRDMRKRAEIIASAAPVLVISVHQNSFSLPTRRGAQVFYRADSERSATLANLIQNALNEMPECVRKSNPLTGDYFMLNCSEYPSVIVEGGFMTNAEDEALLLNAEYRKKLAKAIAEGALEFIASAANG